MSRVLVAAYGGVAYLLFLAVFVYLIGFVNSIGVPKPVDSGWLGDAGSALGVDVALLLLFGVQHSLMARPAFKRWLAGWLPEAAERSTYVLATNLVLIVLFICWRPIEGELWRVESPLVRGGLWLLAASGWGIALVATFLTDHFDLFGLRQVWLHLLGRAYAPVPFREWLFYRAIRHPMMLGLFIAFWAAPTMSMSRFVLVMGLSIYIVIGVHYEERGLRRALGQPYLDYQARTGRFLPFL